MEFAIDACAAYTALDDLSLATHWHRASHADVSPTLVGSGVHLRYLSNNVELAIARGDRDEALATIAILDWNQIGDSVRGRAFFKAMNVRALQLDPLYQLGDVELDELHELFEQTKTLLGADPLALAYAEGLRRRGLDSRRSALLTNYLTRHRRELTKPGPALYALGEELGA